MIHLRDYQLALMNGIRGEFAKGVQAILAQAPTGAGKGVLNAYIGQNCLARGNSMTTVVHRNELVDQLSEKLHEFGVPHGIIAAGKTPTHHPIQVASVQTLVRRLDQFKEPDLLVVDECHHLTRGTMWGKVLEQWSGAKVVGLTATPTRLDGKGLGVSAGGYFESMVLGPSVEWLITQGYLCGYKLFAPPVGINLEGIGKTAGDWNKGELDARVNQPTITGDAVDHYRRICPKAQGLVFTVSRSHAMATAAEYRAMGFSAAYIGGDTPKDERKTTIGSFREGNIQLLVNCELVTEGFDVPGIVAAQLLRPTESLSLWRQMIGRALRPIYAPGFDLSTKEGRLAAIAASVKPFAVLLDHVGGCRPVKHGFPDDHVDWSLDGRIKRKQGNGERNFSERTCPVCWSSHRPAPKCPECGHRYAIEREEITVEDGELKEVTEADKERIRQERKIEVRKATTIEELQMIAKARGYSPGWVHHAWKYKKNKRQPVQENM